MNKCISYIIASLLTLIVGGLLSAQSRLGSPAIKNYTPLDYGHIGKAWGMDSAPNGLIYFSTDFGLVEFDGDVWKKFKGSKGSVRSLKVLNDSIIYTGSDLDFGVWKRNGSLDFEYQSLYPFKEEVGDISEEFWNIQEYKGSILFISNHNLYFHKDDRIIKIQSPDRIESTFVVGDLLYLALKNGGLSVLKENNIETIADIKLPTGTNIKGGYESQDGFVVVTQKSGLFIHKGRITRPIKNALSAILKEANVFCFDKLTNGQLAFGTVSKGIILANEDGQIMHQINRQKGLLNNTILSVHMTSNQQMWLGLDYGISYIRLADKRSFFFDNQGNFGTGYTASMHDRTFYLGTNQGLYSKPLTSMYNDNPSFSFDLVAGTEGQVWSIQLIEDDLLIGHDRGVFIKQGNTFRQVSDIPGVWTLVPHKGHILAGTYNGIYILKKESNRYVQTGKIGEILGSCNQLIIQGDNTIWVNIPNFGIVRAELDDALQPTEREIFPEEDFKGVMPQLSVINDQIAVTTDKSIYIFHAQEQQFSKDDRERSPLALDGQLPGIYQPVKLRENIHFYPVYNGFALVYDEDDGGVSGDSLQVLFRTLLVYNNDTSKVIKQNANIDAELNNIIINWTAPFTEGVKYQYRIGDNSEWSSWSQKREVNLVNLPSGRLTFNLRAKDKSDHITVSQLILQVDTPWYRSSWAYVLYFCLLLIVVALLNLWKKSLLQKQRRVMILKEQHALDEQALKYEKEIMLIEQERLLRQNDELKQKLREKTIELAAKAKLTNEKNRLLSKLNEKFGQLKANPSPVNIKWNEIQSIFNESLDDQDKSFEIQMDDLHQEYIHKLEEKFPNLSRNDLRMCAYIKIGMDTKEIANILNVKPSSAYISRSRLRKKLNLDVEEDLFKFLNSI